VGEKRGADDAEPSLRAERSGRARDEANRRASLGELLSHRRDRGASESSGRFRRCPGPTRELLRPFRAFSRSHEELQLLRDERKIIRAKVQNLLERIERIDRLALWLCGCSGTMALMDSTFD
jgi:hypothetical protein